MKFPHLARGIWQHRARPEYGALNFQARCQIDARRESEEYFKRNAVGANAILIDILRHPVRRVDLLNQIVHQITISRGTDMHPPGKFAFDVQLVTVDGLGAQRQIGDLPAVGVEHFVTAGISESATIKYLQISLGYWLIDHGDARR